jgi:uncharacterized glyoxalase superfamily protein PhnB
MGIADGSIHVAEMCINGRDVSHSRRITANQTDEPHIGKCRHLLNRNIVEDPHAIAAGGEMPGPLQSYDYGYGQGLVTDPTGHQWLIKKELSK